MIRDGHLSQLELLLLLWFVLGSKIFLTVTRIIISMAYNSTPIALALGTSAALGIVYVIYKLSVRFPGETLISISESILGRLLGKVVSLGFAAFLIVITSLRLREFSETISAVVLPTTPISVITLTYTLLFIYAAWLGIEAIGRSSLLLLPFVVIPAVAISLMALQWADLKRALPLIDVPLLDLAKASAYSTSLFGEVTLLALFAPYVRRHRDVLAGGVYGVLLANFIITSAVVLTVVIFTARNTLHMQFPTYLLASIVTLGTFVQRVEALYVFVWFFSAVITLSVLFHATCLAIAQILDLKEYKRLIGSLAVIAYTIAFFPSNIITAFDADFRSIGAMSETAILALPLGLLIIASLLGKRGKSAAKSITNGQKGSEGADDADVAP